VSELRIRFAGRGGQGVAAAALLLADAAVRAGRNATFSQSYGPESRGGASKADVIVSDEEIAYPIASALDVLVALSASGRDRYLPELRPGGLLIADSSGDDAVPGTVCAILPITATARATVGNGPGANLVALGAFVETTGVVPIEAVEAAISARPPGGSVALALAALHAGSRLATPHIGAAREAMAM